jgi:hypothetical protein
MMDATYDLKAFKGRHLHHSTSRAVRSSLEQMSVATGTSCSGSAGTLIGNSHVIASGVHNEGYIPFPQYLMTGS